MSLAGMKYYFSKKGGWFFFLASRGLLNWMPDKVYLKKAFRYNLGYELDLQHPETFSEKLQWLKIHDHNPLYTRLVDKYEVREYIAQIIGEEHLIPLVGGPWNGPEEIDFDALPERFVLKCTHDSGGLIICRDKSLLNREAAKQKLAKCLRRNFYWSGREFPYRSVRPRIIAEAYMEDDNGDLPDYKFFTFYGKVPCLFIASERCTGTVRHDYYDAEFHHLPIFKGHPNADSPPEKPHNFDEMIRLAELLGKDFPHVRVDFYSLRGKIFFGELTFYTSSGLVPFDPRDMEQMFTIL